MEGYQFLDEKGTFRLEQAENYSGLYFPIAGEAGLKGAVTPNLGGDLKLDQNSFLLEPVSIENLHNNRGSRNFWCRVKDTGCWSATGQSAEENSRKFTERQDKSSVTAGPMWHTVTRESLNYRLRSEITSFVSVEENIEVMVIRITNISDMPVSFVPTAAIPIYGRSADNIRDHRHVTSLLHRIRTTECGVEVTPTLSFDERGHRENDRTYFVCGFTGDGETPEDFYPVAADFIGEGGNFERPVSVIKNKKGVASGSTFEGMEAFGGLHFKETALLPGETAEFTVLLGIVAGQEQIPAMLEKYKSSEGVQKEFERGKAYWEEKINVACKTGDQDFDCFMHWVSFQPVLRRIYGCSFLPHHDYGKGGRGWRDLWQDCLALLLMNPDGVREMLLSNFGGVRMDGTNATIIGNGPGEFVADRNNITRVWMDHGVWPLFTTKLYIDQTGDIGILEEKLPYFKDRQAARGTKTDENWDDAYGQLQKTADGNIYEGTVLEHLLLQNLTAFYEVGEHGHMRLLGADWNDALDMAKERGESVAFTNAYAKNLDDLSELLLCGGMQTAELTEAAALLLSDDEGLYDSAEEKRKLLVRYLNTCVHDVSGKTVKVPVKELAAGLKNKAEWIKNHIRNTEWVDDGVGRGWFNGYYDNHGRRVEGKINGSVRMMLTGQVFSVMANTADDRQVRQIIESADHYLYQEEVGGYRLNTDFGGLKTDLGRMFGFAYGEKENGAVFSHMTVMYANALYRRGFSKEGYKALFALERQSLDFSASRIYPGIPEYFNGRGRGMYHYLTGAASWYLLTVITEMFGVRGKLGDLILEPKLLDRQFAKGRGKEKTAELALDFGGRHFKIIYRKLGNADYGEYKITTVKICADMQREDGADGKRGTNRLEAELLKEGRMARIPLSVLKRLDGESRHMIEITLE